VRGRGRCGAGRQPAINPGAAARALNRATGPAGKTTGAAPSVRAVTERVTVPPEQIRPSERTPADIAKFIGSQTSVNIEVSTTKSGLYIFQLSGAPDNIGNAKRRLMDRIVKPVRALAARATEACLRAHASWRAGVSPPVSLASRGTLALARAAARVPPQGRAGAPPLPHWPGRQGPEADRVDLGRAPGGTRAGRRAARAGSPALR